MVTIPLRSRWHRCRGNAYGVYLRAPRTPPIDLDPVIPQGTAREFPVYVADTDPPSDMFIVMPGLGESAPREITSIRGTSVYPLLRTRASFEYGSALRFYVGKKILDRINFPILARDFPEDVPALCYQTDLSGSSVHVLQIPLEAEEVTGGK